MTATDPAVAPPRVVSISFQLARVHELHLNQRLHWRVKARRTALIRTTAAYAKLDQCRDARLERASCICLIEFGTRSRDRDPHNWTPTAKAAIDGFVSSATRRPAGAGLWPYRLLEDDNSAYLIGPDMRDGHDPALGTDFRRLTFTFTEIAAS